MIDQEFPRYIIVNFGRLPMYLFYFTHIAELYLLTQKTSNTCGIPSPSASPSPLRLMQKDDMNRLIITHTKEIQINLLKTKDFQMVFGKNKLVTSLRNSAHPSNRKT